MKLTSLVLAAVVVAGCGSGSQTVRSVEHMRKQPTSAKVSRHDITGYLLLPGSLYVPPTEQAIARAPYGAPIDQVMAVEGQRVGRGQALIKLSLPDQEQYLASAEANLRAAESALANAKVEYGGDVRTAERNLAQARRTERQMRTQTAQGGDGTELENAVTERQAAEETLIQAQAEMNTNLLPYKQQLEAAQSAYKEAKAGVRQTHVTAPITGTIVQMNAHPGETIAANAQVAQIVDLGALQIKVDLTPAESAHVEKGKDVVITFVGMPDKSFDGKVADVDTLPATTSGVKRQATVNFDNDGGVIKPGMNVKSVGVKLGEAKDVLAVPADAVTVKDGKSYVDVMTNGKWLARLVTTGLTDGFLTEIKDGLEEGDVVRVPAS